ncbi:hypothetical protein AQUCO_08200041v1 [Aquilegia coerulea]|uniref:Uncharacterized protein n=1 Tax=Aquilegia coerulea TaxID=218851 RepID=A0A2G5C7I9_AQUCA|nr:hypothetical protein AQUCO_08200041v1 [Aquilegia coerulea]
MILTDFFPHAISKATTPKLYTSDFLLALPVQRYSAKPKSPSLGLKSESNMTLLGLMSRCTTHCSLSS